MEINDTNKGKYSKIILKGKNRLQKQGKNKEKTKKKTYSNEKKPCLKKKEVCFLSPNFKLASK